MTAVVLYQLTIISLSIACAGQSVAVHRLRYPKDRGKTR